METISTEKAERLSALKISPRQAKWLEDEKKRTGNAYSSIVRGLIQEKVDKSEERK